MITRSSFLSAMHAVKTGLKGLAPLHLWRGLRTILGDRPSEPTFRESIEELIEEHHDDGLPGEAEERTMFRNLLDFGRLDVADVMVPRADIVAIPADISLEHLISLICEQGHSRVPVHRGTLDDVAGMVHIRDVLTFRGRNNDFEISSIIRSLLFVPPSMPIQELLLEMRATKIHLALVVDEYGGTDGLVTIEDLVEEIVGEIEDEHDAEDDEVKIKRINDRTIIVDASYKIIELEDLFQLKIKEAKEEEIDTVGGLVSYVASKVPNTNEVFVFNNQLKFKILEADERRAITLEIKKII